MSEERVRIVGVGGGGGKVAGRAAAQMRGLVRCLAVNTDVRELDSAPASERLQIGPQALRGLGAGGDPALGRQAAAESASAVAGLFAGVDLAVVVVALGGGTGTGAAPAVVAAAQERGALAVCFATMPFPFEGSHRARIAEEGLAALASSDAVVVVPNGRLFAAAGDLGMAEAFRRADEALAATVCELCRLVTRPGYIRLDVAALRRAFREGRGCLTFGHGSAAGPDRARRAAEAAVASPVLEGGQVVARAPWLLVGIGGGPDLRLREVGEAMAVVNGCAPQGVAIAMGTVEDPEASDEVRVAILACEPWLTPPAEPAPEEPAPPEASRTVRRKRKTDARQEQLELDAPARGRFKDVEATVLDGQDLDVPTFVRRGLKIER